MNIENKWNQNKVFWMAVYYLYLLTALCLSNKLNKIRLNSSCDVKQILQPISTA